MAIKCPHLFTNTFLNMFSHSLINTYRQRSSGERYENMNSESSIGRLLIKSNTGGDVFSIFDGLRGVVSMRGSLFRLSLRGESCNTRLATSLEYPTGLHFLLDGVE